MTTNPLANASLTALYIVAIATFMSSVPEKFKEIPEIFAPMLILSLFVFSAAVVGYLFLGKPLEFLLTGHAEEGVSLFLKTLGVFALFIVLFLGTLFVIVGIA